MAEVTIVVPDECAALVDDFAVNEARRQLLCDALHTALAVLRGVLDGGGPSDQRPAELRKAAAKVKNLADDLATANEQERAGL